MSNLIIVIAIVVMILVGIYSYHLLQRILKFWYKGEMKRWMRIILAVCSCLLAVGCLNPFGTPALVLYHFFAIALVLDGVNALLRVGGKNKKKQFPRWNRLYRSGLIPVVLTVVILLYGHILMLDVKEKTYSVSTEKALQNADGYKVSFLSDLHFGTTMDAKKLSKYCDAISAENPDLVILGGDIVDERTTKEQMEAAFEELGKITSKYGIFYVYGNHDMTRYSTTPNFSVNELNDSLKANVIYCLADDTYEIGSDLLLVGRQDRGYGGASGRISTEKLLEGQDTNRFILLIDHQPVELQQNAEAGVDLQLSGHTHGGQIWPVGLISDALGFGEMNYGEKQMDDYRVIVSSGIAGWGYAVRTGHDSEYLTINITH